MNVTGKDLLTIGYTEGRIMGLALDTIRKKLKKLPKEEILVLAKKLREYPENFLDDKALGKVAQAMVELAAMPVEEEIALVNNAPTYAVYGKEHIEEGAMNQMQVAMKLPVTVAGALMPDAHQGYGLPIGGVLATKNAIIPYGVGVDIGCRMALSIFDVPETHLFRNEAQYRRELIAHTKFGAGQGFSGDKRSGHPVLDSRDFGINPFVKNLQDKAWTQLGTSGGGNHFVEWGSIEFAERDEELNIEKGIYLALLTHSGSRGLGATIAGHYTRLAKTLCKLPREASNLAYLDMNSEAGQEYWIAMNLAGDYASACHEVIHQKLTRAIGAKVLARVENHHNFAWKEELNGEELIVHRKGATPAGKGVLGIIPGSMAAPGFLVRGKGENNSINSASHGAGRRMSRTKAMENISHIQMREVLKANNISLIGAGPDEAPMAYKDIRVVMASQTELVDVIAEFRPRIVRMADDGSRED
jgi:tRNA-splicing ligase RtcB